MKTVSDDLRAILGSSQFYMADCYSFILADGTTVRYTTAETAIIDQATREGLTLVPLCPFARGWLERHPEAASKAVIDWDI